MSLRSKPQIKDGEPGRTHSKKPLKHGGKKEAAEPKEIEH
jgi:hypothetical protein